MLYEVITANVLMEIPLGIHKTHCHKGDTQIAAFFDVISGQKSQTAGVKRQGTMKSVFSAEISDGKNVRITRKLVQKSTRFIV